MKPRPAGLGPTTCGLEDRCRECGKNPTASTCAHSPERLGVLLGAFAAEITPTAPDLADLLTAWPALPDALKAGIVAMVKVACPAPAERASGDSPKV